MHNDNPFGFFGCSWGFIRGILFLQFCFPSLRIFSIGLLLLSAAEILPMYATRTHSIFSNFLYANDILLFCWGTCSNLKVILGTFCIYGNFSSQRMSLEKTFIYFSDSFSLARKSSQLWVLGLCLGSLPFVYLGVPLFKGSQSLAFWRRLMFLFFIILRLGKGTCSHLLVGFVSLILWLVLLLFIRSCHINGLNICWMLWIKLFEIIFGLRWSLVRKGFLLHRSGVVCLLRKGA